MPGVVENWRVALVERHRDLFQPSADFPGAAQGFPECDAGWCDLLDRLCIRIRAIVPVEDGSFRFSQIKQKFWTLRVYWDGKLSLQADARVEAAIALAEARSAVTREVCGEEGRLRGGSWLATSCDARAEGRRPVEHRSGLENIHLVHHFANGRRFVTCRRYDRQNDVFVDVDRYSLAIEE